MLFPADVFESIVAGLASRAAAVAALSPALRADGVAPARQRRSVPRIALATRLTVVPFAPGAEGLAGYDFPRDKAGALKMPLGEPQSVPVRDLSRGGVRFLLPRRLPLDTPFVLMLPSPTADAGPDGYVAVECAVTYWQPIQRDLFAIGAQFHRVLEGFAAPSGSPTVVLPHVDAASGFAAVRTAV